MRIEEERRITEEERKRREEEEWRQAEEQRQVAIALAEYQKNAEKAEAEVVKEVAVEFKKRENEAIAL